MHLKPLALIFLLVLSLPGWSAEQENSITLNLNDVDIRALITTVAETTGRNFIIDPRVKGKVTVVSTTPVSADKVYEIFLSVLKVHGYSAVPSGDAIKIIPDVNAVQDRVPAVADEPMKSGDSLLTRVVEIEFTDAAQLVPILRPLLPKHAHLAAHANSNTLVVTDSAANVGRIIKIIRRIDKANDRDIEVISLKNTQASDLASILESLDKGVRKKGTPDSRNNRIIADNRTNSLILNGDPAWRQNIRLLIKRLDMPTASDNNTEVIYLQHADAKNLIQVLTGIGEGQLKAQSQGAATTKGASSRTRNAQFDIQADEATNSLVVTAPPFLMQSLKQVIEKLDIRRAQVHIEAIIAEIKQDRVVEFGIQWRTNRPGDGTGASSFLPLGEQFDTDGNPIDPLTNVLGGLTLGYFSGGSLRALLQAAADDGDANILSTPSIMTLDNEEAYIHVGKNIPIKTGEYTGAGDNPDPFNTFDREDVGVKLKVTPQINEGDAIKLAVEQEVSTVNRTDSNPLQESVVTDKRIINTTVLVDSEEIIVLGGLIQDELEEVVSKVPLLGDIPGLGHMFRNSGTTTVKRNLMVFMRTRVIRDKETSADVTDKHYTYIRGVQKGEQDDGVNLMPGKQPPLLPEEYKSRVEHTNIGTLEPAEEGKPVESAFGLPSLFQH